MAPWTRCGTKHSIPGAPGFPLMGSVAPRESVPFGCNLVFKCCDEAVATRAELRSPYHHGPLQLDLLEQLGKLLKGLSCKEKKRLVNGAGIWHWSMGHNAGCPNLAALPALTSKGLPKNREEVAPLGRNRVRQGHR